MMIKIDTHFHPNFLFWLPKKFGVTRQAKNIWKAFEKNDLDGVIVTEHVFKSPALSYKLLLDNKPTNAKTRLIPGVEASTSEGIDMIVFSKDTYVYTRHEIMTTELLSFDEMVDFVNNDDRLYAVVTHPFSPSQTAITKHYPVEKVLDATQKVGFIEKHNASFVGIKRRLDASIFAKISFVQTFLDQLLLLEDVSENHYDDTSVILGGSDAHHPDDLGSYMIFDTGLSSNDLLAILTDYSLPRKFHIQRNRPNIYWFMIRNFFIIARERIITVFGLYAVDSTYFSQVDKKKNALKIKTKNLFFLRLKKKISGIESY